MRSHAGVSQLQISDPFHPALHRRRDPDADPHTYFKRGNSTTFQAVVNFPHMGSELWAMPDFVAAALHRVDAHREFQEAGPTPNTQAGLRWREVCSALTLLVKMTQATSLLTLTCVRLHC